MAPLGWLMFVELPLEEAYAPLWASLQRLSMILLAALVFAVLAGMFLARRMVGPIRALSTGAARIGSGDLGQRITIKTGDELEGLAGQFNEMAGRLQESYAGLERKVEERTSELQMRTGELDQSVRELRALGEVSQAVNSTLDLETVLATIVTKAVQLSSTAAGAIYVTDPETGEFQLRATDGMSEELIEELKHQSVGADRKRSSSAAANARAPLQIADLRNEPIIAGARSSCCAPAIAPCWSCPCSAPTRWSARWSCAARNLATSRRRRSTCCRRSAAQSVLAIQNAHLFAEVEEKGSQLELASQHKSQFLANMSHELRTPLNAIIGLTEMMVTNAVRFGTEKAAEPLRRVHRAGTHLLGLINQVLDLSKIEAGKLELSPESTNLAPLVDEVIGTARQLAEQNKNRLVMEIEDKLPPIMVDPMRLRQILLNLLSNACKFTKEGEVTLRVRKVMDGRELDRACRQRYRHRHDAGAAGQAVRGIHPGRLVDRATYRRHRARPCHHPQARPHDGRRRDGDERTRQGLDLHSATAGSAEPQTGGATAAGGGRSRHALRLHSGDRRRSDRPRADQPSAAGGRVLRRHRRRRAGRPQAARRNCGRWRSRSTS